MLLLHLSFFAGSLVGVLFVGLSVRSFYILQNKSEHLQEVGPLDYYSLISGADIFHQFAALLHSAFFRNSRNQSQRSV
jgi:hypothetical protein